MSPGLAQRPEKVIDVVAPTREKAGLCRGHRLTRLETALLTETRLPKTERGPREQPATGKTGTSKTQVTLQW